ncbi:MAG: carbon-nitrogen hydrolase family protein [Candidatus Caldatribacteriota bacterium]|nr:carbon-nitrogen hydrolase family protein [Candidatus Caldatribacteriota bacterium]
MKSASVEWQKSKWKGMDRPEDLICKIKEYLEKAAGEQVDIIVFPGFTGTFFQQLSYPYRSIEHLIRGVDSGEYIEQIKELSLKYGIAICPGSYWQREKNNTYHESCLIQNGEILLTQRQIYLARLERELGFSRGEKVELTKIKNWNIALMISTDVFYPQVSRMIALRGTDIVLSPVGFIGKTNRALQMSGMWQEVQQNLFFAIESGFNGFLGEQDFWGESIIHAPLEMTEREDGYLDRSRGEQSLIISEMDNEKRKEAISKHDVLLQLNRRFYRQMKMFQVDG